jgi:hypothetical protein
MKLCRGGPARPPAEWESAWVVPYRSYLNYSKEINQFMVYAAVLTLITILFSQTMALANDSVAREGAGGIELIKNDHIRMLEEVLEISTQKVRVRYRFLNESDQDISTKVAFPLPDYDLESHSLMPMGNPNYIFWSFKVFVDNRPVATQSERKAFFEEADITDRLRKLGLSDDEIFFDRDTTELWRKLEPIAKIFGHWWAISQKIFWDMTFPAGKEIVVEHEYNPATGGGYYPLERKHFKESFGHFRENWLTGGGEACLDDDTKRAIENRVIKAVTKLPESITVNYTNVEYILGTGRNWKGPIAEFKLRLEKERPDQFVSVCFPGKPEKISASIYEFNQKDYEPQDNLVVYFYDVNVKK